MLRITTTDPGSINDMAAWAAKTGHQLLAQTREESAYAFYIQKVG